MKYVKRCNTSSQVKASALTLPAGRAVAALLLLVAIAIPRTAHSLSTDTALIEVTSEVVGTSQLELGITHTQYSLDGWGEPAPLASAKALLPKLATYQNQHLMGWGALNPEPTPGQFDWKTLDARMKLIEETGGVPVLTLCCAPDWMKGGTNGKTIWKNLEQAPAKSHFNDYADLAVAALQRYPKVRHVQIWNQMKGFFNKSKNRWDYESYTDLYNILYTRIKHLNPDIKVGGPYVVAYITRTNSPWASELRGPYGTVDRRALDAVEYWLANKAGADFIAIDGHSFDSTVTGATTFDAVTESTMTFYADVDAWLKKKTELPIWWSEWYSSPAIFSEEQQNLLHALTLMAFAKNASVALRWGPQGVADISGGNQESFWSDVRKPNGGKAFAAARTATQFRDCFPAGSALFKVVETSKELETLASSRCLLLANRTGRSVTFKVGDGESQTIGPYGAYFQEKINKQ